MIFFCGSQFQESLYARSSHVRAQVMRSGWVFAIKRKPPPSPQEL